MKVKLLFFVLFLVNFAAKAQNQFESIDEHVYNTPENIGTNLVAITKYVCQPAQNDLGRVRAIFTWISNNIDYDVAQLRNPAKLTRQTVAQTLGSKRAICQGYAELFVAMCAVVGIKSEVVAGYSVPLGVALKKAYFNSNHAWNVVQINGEWQPLDVTWASGYIDNSGKEFEGLFNDKHFLTPPSQFINTHIPEDPQWQLLNQTVSIHFINPKTTNKQLIYNKNFFNYGDSIAFWQALPSYEQALKSAINAHNFNPGNNEKLAIAYYNYSIHLIKVQVNTNAYYEARTLLERAIELSEKDNFEQAKGVIDDCDVAIDYINEKLNKWQ